MRRFFFAFCTGTGRAPSVHPFAALRSGATLAARQGKNAERSGQQRQARRQRDGVNGKTVHEDVDAVAQLNGAGALRRDRSGAWVKDARGERINAKRTGLGQIRFGQIEDSIAGELETPDARRPYRRRQWSR